MKTKHILTDFELFHIQRHLHESIFFLVNQRENLKEVPLIRSKIICVEHILDMPNVYGPL